MTLEEIINETKKTIYGRVNRMLVYCPFEEVLESLKTVNKNASGSAEEMFIS